MTEAVVRPTPERIRKGDVIANVVQRGEEEKPWNTLTLPHEFLDIPELYKQAGSRFHIAYITAHGSDTRTHKWERGVDGGQRRDISPEQADARKDLARWEKLLEPSLYAVLVASCGHGQASSRWASDREEHPSCGPFALAVACGQLARLL